MTTPENDDDLAEETTAEENARGDRLLDEFYASVEYDKAPKDYMKVAGKAIAEEAEPGDA